MRLTQQTAGNGVVTRQSFDPQTGRLTAILAGAGSIVENFSYTYDVLGNVLSRADANQNLTETFTYDAVLLPQRRSPALRAGLPGGDDALLRPSRMSLRSIRAMVSEPP